MKESKMTQRCKDDKVPGNGNWENYMWPHQLDKTTAPPTPQSSGRSASMMYCNNVGGDQIGSFNGASIKDSQITIKK